MSSSIVITLAAIGGIIWLGFILVAALRRRGPEEVPSNLAPGTTDDRLETRRLETSQKAAVLLSAFLAVSLPLYFLGEQSRQEGFVEQFSDESTARGEALVEEFACWNCHGPDGVGGAAPYVEKRSGVTVSWEAPALNDIFYRYDEAEVNFWVTYGRGNTPMPAWGLAGGGPMTEQQVDDVVNYLRTIQRPQMEVVADTEAIIQAQRDRLANAEQTAEDVLARQRQTLADIDRQVERADEVERLAERAAGILDNAGEGIDTDGDGLSDAAETELVAVGEELVAYLRVIDPVTLDPENPESVEGTDDLTTASRIVAELEALVESGEYPALRGQAEAAARAFDQGVVDPEVGISEAASTAIAEIAESVGHSAGDEMDLAGATEVVEALEEAAAAEDASEDLVAAAGDARAALDGGQDPDGDGLASDAEIAISNQLASAIDETIPSEAVVPNLDPNNEATTGEPDAQTAGAVVAGYESLAINYRVTANNIDTIRPNAEAGVAFLEEALEQRRWEIDVEGVAEAAFEGDTDRAERAVLLYNGYCARCHTAGFVAGVPFTLEAGSGGFGPALWDGRPTVQFGPPAADPEGDLLIQFLINGSEAETPYGLNGFGSGRMPAFGQMLPLEDIELIAQYLRGADMTGMGDDEVGP